MVDMASNLMLVDEHLLWLAQREDKACSGILGALERIGGAVLSPHAQHISVVMWVSTGEGPALPLHCASKDSELSLRCQGRARGQTRAAQSEG